MASLIFNSFKKNILDADIDLLNDTIKVALVTASYTPTAGHDFFSDITNEVSGTGYTAGGATLASKTTTAGTTASFDAADTSWTTATINAARYAIIYKDTGNAATSPLIAAIDLGGDKTSTAGTFLITWDAAGILTITS